MPDTDHPAFRRAVVALNGGSSDARIVRLVADYATRAKAEVIAIHVVEIDWTLPLDADIAGRSEDVQRVLDVAEAIAERAKLALEPVLLQAWLCLGHEATVRARRGVSRWPSRPLRPSLGASSLRLLLG